MEIRELTLQEMEILYREWMSRDFPPQELRPLDNIQELMRTGCYHGYGYFIDGLAAYATIARGKEGGLLLDYYAVDGCRRGQGIGSQCLALMAQKLRGMGEPFVLIEVESIHSALLPEEREARAKRIRFYVNCGCIATALYSRLFGIEYQILVLPLKGEVPREDTAMTALQAVYHTIIPPLVGESREEYEKICRCYRRENSL